MVLPELIIFDFGNTLFLENDVNEEQIVDILLLNVISDNSIDKEEIVDFLKNFISKIKANKILEIPMIEILRILVEFFNLKLTKPLEKIESILLERLDTLVMTEGCGEMLDWVISKHIRVAILSNTFWSGRGLKNLLFDKFPNYSFEMVITSADCFLKKPDRVIFDIALRKTGIEASKVWFCGNNFNKDIIGASQCGILPIYINFPLLNNFISEKNNVNKRTDILYYECDSWKSFLEMLSECIIDK